MPQNVCSAPLATALRNGARDTVAADSRQAEYFRRILEAERAKLDKKIANDLRKLAALRNLDEAIGAKAAQRRVRVMQRQRHELDRLIGALDCRLASWHTTYPAVPVVSC